MRIVILTLLFMIALLGCNSPKELKGKEQKESTEDKKYGFYFLLHGQTLWSISGTLKGEGSQDSGLNQTGIKQATQAGAALKTDLDNSGEQGVIIASSLKRDTQTAEKILEITNISIADQEEGLKEGYYSDHRAETPEIFAKQVRSHLKEVLNKYKLLSMSPVIVSCQKYFECISEELTGTSHKLSQGEVAHFTTRGSGKEWELKILKTD